MTANTETIEEDGPAPGSLIPGEEILEYSGDSLARAWSNGSWLDERGNVWLSEDHLHPVLKIKAFAELSRFRPEKKDITVHEGTICFRGARVAELLVFVSEKNVEAKSHAEESKNLYREIRNSAPAVERQHAYLEQSRDLRKRLKQRRIRNRRLFRDELTGKWLRRRSAEFVHIRNPCFYPELEDQVWNGVVVNRATGERIREKLVADEVELLRLCREEGWDRRIWTRRFLESLPTNYRRVMELEPHSPNE